MFSVRLLAGPDPIEKKGIRTPIPQPQLLKLTVFAGMEGKLEIGASDDETFPECPTGC